MDLFHSVSVRRGVHSENNNLYHLFSQLRADQMPGPPPKGQPDMHTLSKHASTNSATALASSCHMKRIRASSSMPLLLLVGQRLRFYKLTGGLLEESAATGGVSPHNER